jgi:hypothetical protein
MVLKLLARPSDSSPAPIDVLYELRQTKPELFDKLVRHPLLFHLSTC